MNPLVFLESVSQSFLPLRFTAYQSITCDKYRGGRRFGLLITSDARRITANFLSSSAVHGVSCLGRSAGGRFPSHALTALLS